MPQNVCPHKKDVGYVASRRCTAPCGGWVVLYDRNKGALPHLPAAPLKGVRWVLVHRDSWRWCALSAKKPDCLKIMEAAAKGEDPHQLLPETLDKKLGPPLKAALQPPPGAVDGKSGANHDSPGSQSSHAHAREGSSASAEPPKAPELPDALSVQRALNEAFPASRIVAEYEAGLGAMKGFVLRRKEQDGTIVESLEETPDAATRIKYLDSLTKYRIGMPDKREKPKEPKSITYQDLRDQLLRSPAARRHMRELLHEAEEEDKAARAKAAAEEAAKEAAKKS